MSLLNNRQSGATRLGAAFIALILVTVVLLAYTKYVEISTASKGSVENGVIQAVRMGLDDYAYESSKNKLSKPYPPRLDEASLGKATSNNLFFTLVLDKRIAVGSGIAVEGWSKTAKNAYVAPSGKQYVYDPETGVFDVPAAATNKK